MGNGRFGLAANTDAAGSDEDDDEDDSSERGPQRVTGHESRGSASLCRLVYVQHMWASRNQCSKYVLCPVVWQSDTRFNQGAQAYLARPFVQQGRQRQRQQQLVQGAIEGRPEGAEQCASARRG
ncbi:hypothetical protein BM1_05024 [Bipolaris maydis]|nr:hypothetical protein BM1_05024 [Bipolaris maydis]